MKTKTLKIEIPEGYVIDKEKSTFEQIVFKKKENELPKKWEDLKEITGYWINDTNSEIQPCGCTTHEANKYVFKTREQAEAAVALAQLSQLMYEYNEGWEPDWTSSESKYMIYFANDKIYTDNLTYIKRFLTFKTAELRDKFLENFKDLIKTAKPLL